MPVRRFETTITLRIVTDLSDVNEDVIKEEVSHYRDKKEGWEHTLMQRRLVAEILRNPDISRELTKIDAVSDAEQILSEYERSHEQDEYKLLEPAIQQLSQEDQAFWRQCQDNEMFYDNFSLGVSMSSMAECSVDIDVREIPLK